MKDVEKPSYIFLIMTLLCITLTCSAKGLLAVYSFNLDSQRIDIGLNQLWRAMDMARGKILA